MGDVVSIILALLSALIAGSAAAITFMKTARAIRAKHRFHLILKYQASRDAKVASLLEQMSSTNPAEGVEMERLIATLEKQIYLLSKEDRRFIEEGLHQRSREGVSRYIREVAI